MSGNLTLAQALTRDAMREFRRVQDPLMTANCFFVSALVASQRQAYGTAARLLGAADVLYDVTGSQLIDALQPEQAALIAATRAALGQEGFAKEWTRGASLPLEDAVAQALVGG